MIKNIMIKTFLGKDHPTIKNDWLSFFAVYNTYIMLLKNIFN